MTERGVTEADLARCAAGLPPVVFSASVRLAFACLPRPRGKPPLDDSPQARSCLSAGSFGCLGSLVCPLAHSSLPRFLATGGQVQEKVRPHSTHKDRTYFSREGVLRVMQRLPASRAAMFL